MPRVKPKPDDLLTVAEVAAYLRVSPQRVRQWIADDRIPAETFGSQHVIRGRDCRRPADLRRRKTTP